MEKGAERTTIRIAKNDGKQYKSIQGIEDVMNIKRKIGKIIT